MWLSYTNLKCTCHRRNLWSTEKMCSLVSNTLNKFHIFRLSRSESWNHMQLECIVNNRILEYSHCVPSLVKYKRGNLCKHRLMYQELELSIYKHYSCIKGSWALICMMNHSQELGMVHKSSIYSLLAPVFSNHILKPCIADSWVLEHILRSLGMQMDLVSYKLDNPHKYCQA